jgi:hypothetical protein
MEYQRQTKDVVGNCTVKKVIYFPSPARIAGPNSLWWRIIKLFLARESLVSDIPAGDGKIGNLFLTGTYQAMPLT